MDTEAARRAGVMEGLKLAAEIAQRARRVVGNGDYYCGYESGAEAIEDSIRETLKHYEAIEAAIQERP